MTIPFVAMWSAEQEAVIASYEALPAAIDIQILNTDGHTYVIYPPDFPNLTELEGITWNSPPEMQGQGHPLFGEVHSTRQRICVNMHRCQVCAGPIGDGPWRWLTSEPLDGLALTQDAPTCDACFETALQMCPHMLKGINGAYNVRSWHVWGVACRLKQLAPTVDSPYLFVKKEQYQPHHRGLMVAMQSVIQFTDYERIDT